ncbi:hypothetical protein HDA32_000685 [Spinactinospora alkalitolerans]|uniref:Uncharacterized protein n=1 Tax=Spinactinospora alkalitolerans TaxID=687207 RepID=A0A852TPM9_9ACTN|nr:hypothetical protein [Spinactinospora alkalitolerans]NYE45565.1 hypothetical protein [Spinactinospora alkalitolerans]
MAEPAFLDPFEPVAPDAFPAGPPRASEVRLDAGARPEAPEAEDPAPFERRGPFGCSGTFGTGR